MVSEEVAALEAACDALAHPDAATRQRGESALLSLRGGCEALPRCRALLLASRRADAQFQAALALRASALAAAPLLPPGGAAELRLWCLEACCGAEAALPAAAAAQLLALHAQLLKRDWAGAEPSAGAAGAWAAELVARAGGAAGAAASAPSCARSQAQAGRWLDALTALVLEFAPASAAAGGLSWAAHLAAAARLQAHSLLPCFQLAAAAAAALAAAPPGQAAALRPALRLAGACLAWDWAGGGRGVGERPADAPAAPEPPADWRAPLLIGPSAPLAWLAPLLLRAGGAREEEAALLLQLCALRGAALAEPGARRAHLSACLSLAGALAARGGEEAMGLGCAGLEALAAAHAPADWPREGFEALRAAGLRAAAARGEAGEAALAACCAALASLSRRVGEAAPPLAAACRDVFLAACEAALAEAACGGEAEGEGGGDEGDGGEAACDPLAPLEALAALARADAAATLPRLGGALAAAAAALGGPPPARAEEEEAALERLTWLLRCCACVLADAPEGETPLPPDALLAGEGAQAACCELSRALLRVCASAGGEGPPLRASPRLLETLLAAAARWADTWLMAEEEGARGRRGAAPPPALALWGAAAEGPRAAAALAQLAARSLAAWPGEVALGAAAAARLLPALARRPAAARALLAHAPAWGQLAGALAAAAPPLDSLPPKTHRLLARALARGASGAASEADAAAYVRALLSPSAALLAEAARWEGGLGGWLRARGGEGRLLCALEALAGGAQGTLPRSRGAQLALLEGAAGSVSALAAQAEVRARPPLLLACVRLAAATLESQLPYASAAEAGGLARFGLDLVRGAAAAAAAEGAGRQAGDAAVRQQEAYKRTKALLALLEQVTSRDLLCFGEGEAGCDVPALVLAGLHALLPLLTADALRFPKLARRFFSLAAHCGALHAAAVARLPPPQLAALWAALLAGAAGEDGEAAAGALEAAEGLAKHAARGGEGAEALRPLLPQLAEALLARLLLRAAAPTDGAADALLPCLLAAPAAWQALLARLGEQARAAGGAAAADAFARAAAELVEANGLQPALDRANARRFRVNVAAFAATARGLVRMT